jgi:hypothetical protein
MKTDKLVISTQIKLPKKGKRKRGCMMVAGVLTENKKAKNIIQK